MTCSNIYDLKKIPIYYEELRGKKLFTKALSEIDVNKKSVHLFYYKNANIPICALPKLGVVIISKRLCNSCYFLQFRSTEQGEAALLQRGPRLSKAPAVPTRRWSVLLQPG